MNDNRPLFPLLTATAGLAAIFSSASVGADTIYVSNAFGNTIEKFTSAGVGNVFTTHFVSEPQGLALDSLGNLYVASYQGNQIAKLTPDALFSNFSVQATNGLINPVGLAFDQAGNLYASIQRNGSILKFTPEGAVSVFATNVSAFSAHTLVAANGLAVDSG